MFDLGLTANDHQASSYDEVIIGNNAILRCNYTRVGDLSHLTVTWRFSRNKGISVVESLRKNDANIDVGDNRKNAQQHDKHIWTFEGDKEKDMVVNSDSIYKYERVASDIHTSHAPQCKQCDTS